MTHVRDRLIARLFGDEVNQCRQVLQAHILLVKIPVRSAVRAQCQVRITKARAPIIAHPDVITGSCQYKGICALGIVPDPLHHVAILRVHHQHYGFLHTLLHLAESARYAIQRQNVVIWGHQGVAFCAKPIFLADFFHAFESVAAVVESVGENGERCSLHQDLLKHFPILYT